jgi:hypothetical protein
MNAGSNRLTAFKNRGKYLKNWRIISNFVDLFNAVAKQKGGMYGKKHRP